MPVVHVTPVHDIRRHETRGRCWCEPTVHNLGMDSEGGPARVMVHTDQDERRGLPPRGGGS